MQRQPDVVQGFGDGGGIDGLLTSLQIILLQQSVGEANVQQALELSQHLLF